MAGDWIKMRGNLWDDPRVARLCDLTDSAEGPVIGALYWLWATADQHSEDGAMPGLTLRQIDRKTGLPGFAAALCEIGWLIDDPQGVVIQKFEEHNGESAKKRCQTAKRVANHRARSGDVTLPALPDEDTGVSGALAREEKRREESPPSEPNGSSGGGAPQAAGDAPPPAAAAAATSKGSRLSEAWRLPKGWGDWALGEFPQWDAAKVRREGEAFRDHWVAKTGKDATKRDWEATWRNWCRSSIAHRDDPRGGAAVTPAESAAAGARAAAMTRQMLDAQDAVPLAKPETVAAARQRLGLKPTLEPAPVEGEAA